VLFSEKSYFSHTKIGRNESLMNITSNVAVKTVAPKKPWTRRLRLKLILSLLLLLFLLFGIVCGGIGFYFSNVLLTPTHRATNNFTLEATNVGEHSVTLPREMDTEQAGTFGITWSKGEAIVGAITSQTQNTVTRQLLQTTRPLASHTLVDWNREIYLNDLKNTLGLPISTVQVPGPLGQLPALYVPGKLDTWAILVHGRSDTSNDNLRFFPPLAKLGLPILDISYRNDTGAPASPDGFYHLGDSEWQDLEANVKYALAHGAQHLLLYGWSMGGATVEAFQHHSTYANRVQALVLDAPALDWRSTLILQAQNRGFPGVLANTAEVAASLRAGINFDALDQLHQSQGRTPILLFHGTADTTTPIAVSDTFAREHSDIVTYYRVNGANHVESWNNNPQLYEEELRTYLVRVLQIK
jgi:pimeloyl-ACP methyl ester carboxylesterase